MKRATLDQMWQTISANKAPLLPIHAQSPINRAVHHAAGKINGRQWLLATSNQRLIPLTKAAEFIVNNFAKFSPKMASFAQHAFENGWIEAEDRPGKRAGGYMTSVPDVKESRIFMTFDGSASGVSTIAHELGHAFHQFYFERHAGFAAKTMP